MKGFRERGKKKEWDGMVRGYLDALDNAGPGHDVNGVE